MWIFKKSIGLRNIYLYLGGTSMPVWKCIMVREYLIIASGLEKTKSLFIMFLILRTFYTFRKDLRVINFRYIQLHFVHEVRQSGKIGPMPSIVQQEVAICACQTKTWQNFWSSVTQSRDYGFWKVHTNYPKFLVCAHSYFLATHKLWNMSVETFS